MKKLYALVILLYVVSVQPLYADGLPLAFERLRETTLHVDIGSASIVEAPSGKHYILTNDHVCRFGKWKGTLFARFPEGPSVKGRIVKTNARYDLCAVELSKQPAALKVGKRLRRGQKVYTRGFPQHILTESFGIVGGSADWEYSFPIGEIGECPPEFHQVRDPYEDILVACRARYHTILTNLYGRPGSSGSPVVNDAGELVGVISSWSPDGDFEAGMVELSDVKDFLSDL